MTAPIALFVYNRPEHTRKTVEALQKNLLASESDLFIYSDAPRSDGDAENVDAVREYLGKIVGFRSVSLIERKENLGVDQSVIDGVTSLCNRFGKAIVLEDDLVTAPSFLEYMNTALDKYYDDPSVMQVSGFMFPIPQTDQSGAFFLKYATSWGWATWKRAWQLLDRDTNAFSKLKQNPAAIDAFNVNGAYDHFHLLERVQSGQSTAWDIRWYLTIFERNGLTLFPRTSLVDNIGFDGSGVHSSIEDRIENTLSPIVIKSFPQPHIDTVTWKHVENYLRSRTAAQPVTRLRGAARAVKRYLSRHVSRTRSIQVFQARQRTRLLFLQKDVGEDTFIDRTVHVLGWKHVSIGSSTAISEGTWINVNHRISGHKHIVIGNNCYIGKRNFFSSGWQIFVGDYCMTGLDCKFMGSDHIFNDPLKPYITSGVTNEKTIRIGTNVWIGASVTIVGQVEVGYGSVIGAAALVNKSVPPFSLVIGNPCKVHKRYDFVVNDWVAATSYDPAHDRAMPDEKTYAELLKAAFPRIPMPLQASSRSLGDML